MANAALHAVFCFARCHRRLGLEVSGDDVEPLAQNLFGWRQDEALGLVISSLLGPDMSEICEMLLSAGDDEHFYDRQIEVIDKERKRVEVSLSGAVMRHTDGTPWGFVVLMVDLTERTLPGPRS